MLNRSWSYLRSRVPNLSDDFFFGIPTNFLGCQKFCEIKKKRKSKCVSETCCGSFWIYIRIIFWESVRPTFCKKKVGLTDSQNTFVISTQIDLQHISDMSFFFCEIQFSKSLERADILSYKRKKNLHLTDFVYEFLTTFLNDLEHLSDTHFLNLPRFPGLGLPL